MTSSIYWHHLTDFNKKRMGKLFFSPRKFVSISTCRYNTLHISWFAFVMVISLSTSAKYSSSTENGFAFHLQSFIKAPRHNRVCFTEPLMYAPCVLWGMRPKAMCFQLSMNHINDPVKYTLECPNAIIITHFIITCLFEKNSLNIFLSLLYSP